MIPQCSQLHLLPPVVHQICFFILLTEFRTTPSLPPAPLIVNLCSSATKRSPIPLLKVYHWIWQIWFVCRQIWSVDTQIQYGSCNRFYQMKVRAEWSLLLIIIHSFRFRNETSVSKTERRFLALSNTQKKELGRHRSASTSNKAVHILLAILFNSAGVVKEKPDNDKAIFGVINILSGNIY